MSQTEAQEIPLMRVPISVPCSVPVLPGTPSTDEPIEQRIEKCAVDAWWVIGRAPICDLHLRSVVPDLHADALAGGVETNSTETLPWAEQHRYPQDSAQFLGDPAAPLAPQGVPEPCTTCGGTGRDFIEADQGEGWETIEVPCPVCAVTPKTGDDA